MKQVMARLAAMAGVVVLTAGLPALAGPAYGAGHAHGVARPASGLSRLERLGRGALFRNFLAASAQGELAGVDVRARADGWAVGSRCTGRCQDQYTLIEHWNGRRWTRVPSPNPSTGPAGVSALEGVTAVSGRDAWAAGLYGLRNGECVHCSCTGTVSGGRPCRARTGPHSAP